MSLLLIGVKVLTVFANQALNILLHAWALLHFVYRLVSDLDEILRLRVLLFHL